MCWGGCVRGNEALIVANSTFEFSKNVVSSCGFDWGFHVGFIALDLVSTLFLLKQTFSNLSVDSVENALQR